MNNQLAILKFDNAEVELKTDVESETLWGTQEQIAQIFNTDKSGVSRHIKNILTDEELDKSSIAKFAIDTPRGKYPVEHYNLDMMIAIGYRVNSKKATDFRKQATQILKQFIIKGVVVDGNRTAELVKILRKFRVEEKCFYSKIKDVFKESASNYQTVKKEEKATFFAFVQDKFLYAITGKTANQLVRERANADKTNMGLYNFTGNDIHVSDIVIGKNYLDEKELEELEILCENFLGFCHLKAFRGQQMDFEEITYKVNQFLEFNGYKAFGCYNQVSRKSTDSYVKSEFKKYKERIKAEKISEKLQKIAIKKNRQITINTINSIQKSPSLKMNKDTNFVVADYLIHGEFYFYGQVMQDGGNMKTHVYLQTKDYGVIKISTSSATIIKYQKSGDLIHHNYVCIRATAMQHMITGKLTNIKFKDLITVENTLNLNISHDSIYNWDNDIQNSEQLVKEIRKVI